MVGRLVGGLFMRCNVVKQYTTCTDGNGATRYATKDNGCAYLHFTGYEVSEAYVHAWTPPLGIG